MRSPGNLYCSTYPGTMNGRIRSRSFTVSTSPGLKSGLAPLYFASHWSRSARVVLRASCASAIAAHALTSVSATLKIPAARTRREPQTAIAAVVEELLLTRFLPHEFHAVRSARADHQVRECGRKPISGNCSVVPGIAGLPFRPVQQRA